MRVHSHHGHRRRAGAHHREFEIMATPGKGYSMKKQLVPHTKDELAQSTATKRTANQAAPANPGMHHVAIPAQPGQPGLIAHGVSKTQSERLLGRDAVGEVHGGAAAQVARAKLPAANVEQHPGTPARAFDPQPGLPDNRK